MAHDLHPSVLPIWLLMNERAIAKAGRGCVVLRRSAVSHGEVTSDESDDCDSGQQNSEIAEVQIVALALSGLTPELSRAAKRRRLE